MSSPSELSHITCVLRRKHEAPGAEQQQPRVSHEELEKLHGADPADIEALERFASERGFSIVKSDAAARSITIAGRHNELSAAFESTLDGRIVAVLGFDNRPIARPYHHWRATPHSLSYTPDQVAHAYNFPVNKGAGQTIALIELGGGFNNSDLQAYWSKLGIKNVSVTAVGVDGAMNSPDGDPEGADAEVALDIEVVGAVAPAARVAVYFGPNTLQGFYDAVSAAVHDRVRKPSVISISWGGPEDSWSGQTMNAFNALFHDAALLGISVCAASGDNGSSDGDTDGAKHLDFPASSPWVLSCGGTKLTAKSETVWNDGSDGGATGGGVSSHFSKPAYQAHINVPTPGGTVNPTGRGVPDVAGNADPSSGYIVIVDGQEGVIGGTSAVAPLWAALIALLNEQLGKPVGWLHPKLYGVLSHNKALHDITSGNNGSYKAAIGWDPCTGLGSPRGQAILDLLSR